MRLFIPQVGTVLKLEEDWKFTLHLEYRNQKFAEALGMIPKPADPKAFNYFRPDCYIRSSHTWKTITVILPAGTELRVDRVYVRKGTSETFNSLSFYIHNTKTKVIAKKRFWAKLDDVNGIECWVV